MRLSEAEAKVQQLMEENCSLSLALSHLVRSAIGCRRQAAARIMPLRHSSLKISPNAASARCRM